MNTLRKSVTIVTLGAALLSSVSAFANNASETRDIRFVGDTQYAGFCQAIVQDDVIKLRKQASRKVGRLAGSQRGVLRAVTSEQGVTCNGKTLIEFSQDKQAEDVHAYLLAQS
ncbi:DUF3718 domain-containing protein [Alteromonas oceanisediminis]|uniref:DUF3718 domain-containing protein n=1 Tax=Alteromonas oceanisediminis TaxID=2836180 RepID=UPI001BDA7A2E|nr:DUF3718 domain-containing protein [Alteromonas oceanisediminis]MBT0585480.1 DUF3718 domain-containing protein [Alteromonas oceanisediminis]